MPEGDAVWRTARRLDSTLTGGVLTRSDVRVPQHATSDLTGAVVLATVSRGKHLLTRLAPAEGPAVTLHTHLKMEGAWHVHAPGTRWRRPAHEARVVLATERWEAVGFALGVVDLLRTADEERVVGHLGPDLLGPGWDAIEALRRLTGDPERTIGEALLDQRNLAGVGTVYRSETLFLTGVSPFLPVSAAPLAKVVGMARRLLQANREFPQITTTGNTRTGERVWVYGRGGQQPCRRCGSRISRTMQGPAPYDRVTYWCPSCQPVRG